MKKAFITGITGQDGSYLAEYLINKGYEVHGVIRRASSFNTQRIDHIYSDPNTPERKLFLHYGDLADPGLLTELVYNIKPDEIYHLGAQSHVRVSFDMPEYTGNVTGIGTTRLLEAIRRSGIKTKFYQASSSELFGAAKPPQNENTPFEPQSPYAIAKLYSYWMVKNYRMGYNIFACNGILFNHESPRRGETFVTRKITRAIAKILSGNQKKLFLGNLDARRDWGFAPEYVEMMWLMLQQDKPEDYCVGTGESHSVRDFVVTGFNYAGVEIEWHGSGIEEKGFVKSFDKKWDNVLREGQSIIEINTRYFRPTEVDFLQADISKAKEILHWQPKINFDELVSIMVDHDMLLNSLIPPAKGIESVKKKGMTWTEHFSVDLKEIANDI
jgi:GDPmannose 4,6-dehydratase